MRTLILALSVIILTSCASNDPVSPDNTPKYTGLWCGTVNNLTFTIEIRSETDKRAIIICEEMDWVWIDVSNNGSQISGWADQNAIEYTYYISGDEMRGTLDLRHKGNVWHYGEATFTRQ